MMKLSNKDIVFLYKHFVSYYDMLLEQMNTDIEMERGQIELYRKIYGKTDKFDKELWEMKDRLVNFEIPKFTKGKLENLKSIIKKLSSTYELIEESDPDTINEVENNYFKQSEEITDLLEKIQKKMYGKD